MDTEEEIKGQKEDGKLIRITKEADDAVVALLRKINEDVDQIRITKSSLTSFLIERFSPNFGDEELKALYMRSVSEVDLLRRAYKQAMDSGVMPENLRELLFTNA